MAPTAGTALPLQVEPTAPTPPPAAADAAATAAPAPSSDRPWYKYLFRASFFFGGDDERVAARFAALRNIDPYVRNPCTREEVRAFVATDKVYGPRLVADETQAMVRGTFCVAVCALLCLCMRFFCFFRCGRGACCLGRQFA